MDEVWILDLTTTSPSWSLYTPATPPGFGRMGHTAIYDSAFQRMIVFGGDDGTGPLNDVMQFSLPATLMDWGAPLPPNLLV